MLHQIAPSLSCQPGICAASQWTPAPSLEEMNQVKSLADLRTLLSI